MYRSSCCKMSRLRHSTCLARFKTPLGSGKCNYHLCIVDQQWALCYTVCGLWHHWNIEIQLKSIFVLGITSLSIEFTRLAIEEMKQPTYLDAVLDVWSLTHNFVELWCLSPSKWLFCPPSHHTCGFSTVTGSKGVLISLVPRPPRPAFVACSTKSGGRPGRTYHVMRAATDVTCCS